MNDNNRLQEIMNIIVKITNSNDLNLTKGTVISEIQDWDSLNSVDLEMAIEEKFGLVFSPGVFEDLSTIDLLVSYIKDYKKN